MGGDARSQALEAFALRYQDNPLALDKWFTVQAATACFTDREAHESLGVVQALLKSQRFDRANPNRVRSLLGAYFMHNQAGLHRADGQGYVLWSEELAKLDRLNGQLTSRLARSLDRWRVYEPSRRALMKQAIESLASSPGLSADTSEICQRLLEEDA
jgi:aminopeptidase N